MANDTLAAIGEALIDFIPDKTGCDFCDVTGFSPQVGGAPANVCAAYSKLGGKSRMITQLGNDPFGEKITRTLRSAGVDTTHIRYTDEANTALAFVSLAAEREQDIFILQKTLRGYAAERGRHKFRDVHRRIRAAFLQCVAR